MEGHLEYFKVKNFKRFDELEMEGLGQFNLITGDNNVGKTSLLESLLVGEDWKELLWNYHRTLNIRGIELNLKDVVDDDGKIKELLFPSFNYLDLLLSDPRKELEVEFKINTAKKTNGLDRTVLSRHKFILSKANRAEAQHLTKEPMPINAYFFIRNWHSSKPDVSWLHVEEFEKGSTSDDREGFPFIPVFRGHDTDDVGLFTELVNGRPANEAAIVSHMKALIPEQLEGIRIFPINGVNHVFLRDQKRGIDMPLSQFGDGAVRLFSILLYLIKNKGGRLMIDEVDNGIHHSRMKNFLTILVKMAVDNNVQLFMTTHSLECQEAFAEVFEDPKMVPLQSEFRNITLVETLDHSVKPFIYTHQQLAENLELGIETRGRKLA